MRLGVIPKAERSEAVRDPRPPAAEIMGSGPPLRGVRNDGVIT
jgi:hypothetical protein